MTGIDSVKNTVTLGRDGDRYTTEVRLRALNLIAADALEGPVWVEAKVRYAAKPDRALLTPAGANTARLVFDTPQRAVTVSYTHLSVRAGRRSACPVQRSTRRPCRGFPGRRT